MYKKLFVLVVLLASIMKGLMIDPMICLESMENIEKIMSSLNEISDLEKEKVDEVGIEEKIDKVNEEKEIDKVNKEEECYEMTAIDVIINILMTLFIFHSFTSQWWMIDK